MENETKFAHLKRDVFGYKVHDENDAALNFLATFLDEEITGNHSYNYYTDWLMEKFNQDHAEGNAYGLRELDGKIYVYSIFDEPEEQLQYFSTTKQKMLDILYNWATIVSKTPPPNEIMITEENGEVEISVVN